MNDRTGDSVAQQILQARARALAAPAPAAEAPGETIEVVEFALSRERYAFEAAWVRDVHPLRQLTVLPGTPPHVLGIVNVRASVLAVVDLRRLFGLPQRGLADLDKLVVLADGAMEFGVLADAVAGVRFLRRDALQPTIDTFAGAHAAYLLGVTAEGVAVLDAARLLRDGTLVVNEQAEGL